MRPKLTLPVRVRSYETDRLGRLQIPILCRWLQEAATIHAAELGVAVERLVDSGVAWVLTRLHLVVRRWPRAEDRMIIETWPEALDRLITERCFEILDGSGEAIGRASTTWVVLDLVRRRPIRLPPAVAGALQRHGLGDRPARRPDLEAPEDSDCQVEFAVRRSDLDRAGHVNNTSYVEWVVEAVPDAVWDEMELEELDIAYLSECRRGSVVASNCEVGDGEHGCRVRHELARVEDGVSVARALTIWRKTGAGGR